MPRLPLHVWLGGAFAAAVIAVAAPADAAWPTQVRVVDHPVKIQVSPFMSAGVLAEAPPGTTLDVLRRDGDWYWIVMPTTAYGTRRSAWVRVDDVEPYDAAAAATAARLLAEREQRGGAPGTTSGEGEGGAGTADDRVVITGRDGRGSAAGASGPAGITSSEVAFEDLHFDLNGYAIHSDDMERLRATVIALKANPTLVVNIEGHTCNLGSAAYNMALGKRRANAVKEFLVSEGIAAERLHTVSYGEKQPKYDNSKEETRQLNRRVAVVPNGKAPDPDAKVPAAKVSDVKQ